MPHARDPLGAIGPRLRAATPLPDAAVPEPPANLIAPGVAALSASSPARPQRRRAPQRRALAIAAACVAFAVPSAALAGYLGVHSGFFPGAHDTESVSGEEYLDTSSPEIVQVVRTLTREVPLPSGASWDALLARYPAKEGLMQRTAIGVGVESYARCRWEKAWLAARAAGDPAGALHAADVLAESATWPNTVTTDGGGVVAHYQQTAAAAHGGDARAVRQDLRANC